MSRGSSRPSVHTITTDKGPIIVRTSTAGGGVEYRDNKIASWSPDNSKITIWDLDNILEPTIWPDALTREDQQLHNVVYLAGNGQDFGFTHQELIDLKTTFNALPPIIQTMLYKHAPHLVYYITKN